MMWAKALSQLSGKEISYTPVDPGTFQNKAKELGMADFAVGHGHCLHDGY